MFRRIIRDMSDDDSPAVARFHWLYWLVGVVACVGLIAAIFWVYQREPSESRGGTPVTASNPSVGGFPPAFNDPRDDLSRRPDFVEVCGVGRVRLPPNGDVDLPEIAAAARQVVRQAAARLAASSNDYDRAVGLYAQSVKAAEQAMSDYWVTRPGCALDEQCMREAMIAAQQAGAAANDQLARHAVGSRSPGIYALAFYACSRGAEPAPASGACAQISSAQWAQIEPDNATPWLYEAGLAARRKDAKAVEEAFLRASRARALRLHDEAPLRFTDRSILRTDDPATTAMAYYQLVGMRAALPTPDFQTAVQYCGASATIDGSRRLLCSDLATVLAERSSTLISMQIGVRVGERAGWSPERVAAVRERLNAINQVSAEAFDPKDPYSCRTLELNNERFIEIFRHGEVGAAERLIQASGKSIAVLAREWTDSHPSRTQATTIQESK
jgi:hypothetical protein